MITRHAVGKGIYMAPYNILHGTDDLKHTLKGSGPGVAGKSFHHESAISQLSATNQLLPINPELAALEHHPIIGDFASSDTQIMLVKQ